MSEKDNNSLFKTTDLALATFLKMSGMELKSSTPSPDNKFKFVFAFSLPDKAKKLKNAYFNRQATVDPLEFINMYRNLKAMVS